MDIREARPNESELIAQLVNAAFAVERKFKNGDRTTSAEIQSKFSQGRFFIAEQDGSAVGTVFVSITGNSGYFGLLAVDPTLQRSGVGRSLIEFAEDLCRRSGCTEMTMCIVSAREDLPAYYSRFGYQVTSTEPVTGDEPFTMPVHFVNMAKPLA
jgi:predicted N-acetyltransferase YhbS